MELLSPSSKKNEKKFALKKKIIFQEMELSCPKKLHKTFKNFLAQKT